MFSLSKYNPGKSFHGSQRHFLLPEDPFEVWGLDFIQMPLPQKYKKKKYIIILYGFRFPMQESRVTKTLMVYIYIYTIYIQFIYIFIHSFPQLGNFLGVSDRRTHFTRQTVQPICKIWSVLQYVYVPTTSSSLDW